MRVRFKGEKFLENKIALNCLLFIGTIHMETLYEYVINELTFGSNKYKIGINNNAQFHTRSGRQISKFEGNPLI